MDHPTLQVDAKGRADAGAAFEVHWRLGARTTVDGVEGYFARADPVNATFFAGGKPVDAILRAPP
jgi:hypothetical protein